MKLNLPPTSPAKDPAGHPLMQGEISKWVWRLYTQRLTPAGRWLILPTLALSTYGGASLQLQGYVVLSYVSALWWVAIVAAVTFRPKVKLSVTLPDRVGVGETLPVDLDLQAPTPKPNRLRQGLPLRGKSRRPRDLTILPHRLPQEIDSLPDDGTPIPQLPARVRLHLHCKRRGAYTLHGFRVESDWPFGILRSRQTHAQDRPLLVYPKFTPLTRLSLPTGRTYQPGGVALASNLGESAEYIGNREYREGDNVRDIDWRATARMTRPIVREYREEYFMRVAVILDTHLPTGNSKLATGNSPSPADLFEDAVSLTAAVSDYMARQDYLVDLFAAGPNLYHLTAGRSLAYLDQILDILACVDPNPSEPFATIEPELLENLSRITTVICVMLDWNPTRQSFVHRLRQQGAAVKVIIVRDTPCTLNPTPDTDILGPIPTLSHRDCAAGVTDL